MSLPTLMIIKHVLALDPHKLQVFRGALEMDPQNMKVLKDMLELPVQERALLLDTLAPLFTKGADSGAGKDVKPVIPGRSDAGLSTNKRPRPSNASQDGNVTGEGSSAPWKQRRLSEPAPAGTADAEGSYDSSADGEKEVESLALYDSLTQLSPGSDPMPSTPSTSTAVSSPMYYISPLGAPLTNPGQGRSLLKDLRRGHMVQNKMGIDKLLFLEICKHIRRVMREMIGMDELLRLPYSDIPIQQRDAVCQTMVQKYTLLDKYEGHWPVYTLMNLYSNNLRDGVGRKKNKGENGAENGTPAPQTADNPVPTTPVATESNGTDPANMSIDTQIQIPSFEV